MNLVLSFSVDFNKLIFRRCLHPFPSLSFTRYKDGNKHEISSAQFVYLPDCHPSSSRPIHRRIDLLVTPRKVFGAVLMGWTGSKQFEKDIRRLATDHGYSVSISFEFRCYDRPC